MAETSPTTEEVVEQPPWMAEVVARRRQSETATDVQKKWDSAIATGGEGHAPWVQEIAGKKKAARDKAEEEAKIPEWLREVKGKNPSLMKNFHEEEPTQTS